MLSTERASPLEPQPTLAAIDDVLARMEAAGLEIDRRIAAVVPARPEVETAVVRIAQEALANVLRHRGAGRAAVELRQDDAAIVLRVDDDGPATWREEMADPQWHRPGSNGLIGMRERARSCGGSVTFSASALGGWRVEAVLPAGRS